MKEEDSWSTDSMLTFSSPSSILMSNSSDNPEANFEETQEEVLEAEVQQPTAEQSRPTEEFFRK